MMEERKDKQRIVVLHPGENTCNEGRGADNQEEGQGAPKLCSWMPARWLKWRDNMERFFMVVLVVAVTMRVHDLVDFDELCDMWRLLMNYVGMQWLLDELCLFVVEFLNVVDEHILIALFMYPFY